MKVEQLVASVQRLSMIKNKSKLKASMNYKNEELKTLWLNLSKEARELLDIYNKVDIYDKQIADCYNKEWLLYAKLKTLNNKDFNVKMIKKEIDKINCFENIIMTKTTTADNWETMLSEYENLTKS
jgi:hypothetical protein